MARVLEHRKGRAVTKESLAKVGGAGLFHCFATN
jgi:hypothetical protein